MNLDPRSTLPADSTAGTLVGRVWRPELDGPSVVAIRADGVFAISRSYPAMRDLSEAPDPAAAVAGAHADRFTDLAAPLANAEDRRDPHKPFLLAPIDLQAIKAAGVAFASALPVHPPVRQRVHARRRAAHAGAAHREGRGRIRARWIERRRQDQPRSGRARGANDRPAPSISRRRGAVPRHHVRAGEGSRRAR